MDRRQRERIECAISAYENLLIVGGTGSGKTTLTNAVIDGIAAVHPEDRLVIIEDTAEIQCRSENAVILRATVDVSMERLLRATLRRRPDRIVVGVVTDCSDFRTLFAEIGNGDLRLDCQCRFICFGETRIAVVFSSSSVQRTISPPRGHLRRSSLAVGSSYHSE